jgi:hypothetical protein
MKVFISYTAVDSELAKKIAGVLQDAGLQVWLDLWSVYPGDNWYAQMARAIQECDAMVALITPAALESPNVENDILFALGNLNYKNRLIPVIAASPDQLPEDQIPWILGRLRAIRLKDYGKDEEDLRQIATALQKAA